MTDDEILSMADENTRLIFGETLSNPNLDVFDIERFASLAHGIGVPLIVDNTFPTPVNCRPFEFGADIVVHSTTKYMDGHAAVLGGAIVDGGVFDWTCGRYPELTEPDESYHGIAYVSAFGNSMAYIVKARVQLMRDFGAIMQATSAFLLNLGLETLCLRVERHCANALKVASFLEKHEKVEKVSAPALPSDPRKPDTVPPLRYAEFLPAADVGIDQAGSVDTLGNRLPDYPLEMRHAGRPGMVELGILVDTLGNVENAEPLQIRGDLKFAYHAIRAVKEWTGFPVKTDSTGAKVWYWTRKKFYFAVESGEFRHDAKGQRRNIYDNVPEDANYGKMLYEHVYNFK